MTVSTRLTQVPPCLRQLLMSWLPEACAGSLLRAIDKQTLLPMPLTASKTCHAAITDMRGLTSNNSKRTVARQLYSVFQTWMTSSCPSSAEADFQATKTKNPENLEMFSGCARSCRVPPPLRHGLRREASSRRVERAHRHPALPFWPQMHPNDS